MGARKLWPVAVLLLTAFLRLVWRGEHERPAFSFEITASSPQPQTMQLYFQRDPAPGLSEASSVTIVTQSTEPRTYRLRLEAGVYRALRFDPMLRGGKMRLSQARIIDAQSGRELCALPVSTWTIGQNIQRISVNDDALHVEVAADQVDPTLTIPLPESTLVLQHGVAGRAFATVFAVLLAAGFVVGAPRFGRIFQPMVMGPLRAIEARIQRVIPAEVLPLDPLAIAFLGGLVIVCATGATLGLHGSSSTIRSQTGIPPGQWEPLYGAPKHIRSDEWGIHTPLVLYQVNRAEPLAVESIIGPGKSILIANAPVRHWTTAFRPQFLPFFVLPPAQAFAAFWQAKNLLLVSGTFLLLLLLTRSSGLAVFGAVWFWLSSCTQWTFSWPALLPEMIGLVGLAVVAASLAFLVPSRRVAAALGVVLVFTTVNFVLCAYPPFQVPLGWAGLGFWIAWLWQVRRAPALRWRQGLVALGGAGVIVALVLALFFREIWPVVEITAQTIYPGVRSMPGGTMSWQLLLSAFLDPLKTEHHYPPQLANICEGTGYFWFGAVSLALAAPLFRDRAPIHGRRTYVALFAPLLLLTIWSVFPVPASIGRLLLLDQVHSSRAMSALGLLNVAITLVFLDLTRRQRAVSTGTHAPWRSWALGAVATISFLALFRSLNRDFGEFFALPHLSLAAVLAGLASWALASGRATLFATLVLVPLVWANLLVNPIDRGLAIYEQTPLRRFLAEESRRDARWLVVSENENATQYCAALGLDVVNAVDFVPDIDRWRRFDPRGDQADFYNGGGVTIVRAMPAGAESHFEAIEGERRPPPMARRWHVDPADARLRTIGVRYFAVQGEANMRHFPATHFERLNEFPIDGFTLFRSRD